MPSTYSVNLGTQFETYRKPDILSVLRDLPDNTSKLISPRDVRDAFLTTWASAAIKQTRTAAGTEYIGIDSGNPSDRDIKQKIFLGKRSFGNEQIMTESLLSSDVDIFIYNTKADNSATHNSTRMSFVAGTFSSLYGRSPYIGSEYNTSTGNIDFVMRNPQINGGSLNIYSSNGNVILNGIKFPTVAENVSATNGKILRYVGNWPNGYLKWDDSNVTISNLGKADTVTSIYGGTVSLNGYELEFVNNTLTPTTIGGVPAGSSFNSTSFNGKKWPLSEVLRKLLYPKVPPLITATATNPLTGNSYAELGVTSSVRFKWDMTIYPRTEFEYISDYYVDSRTGTITTPSNNYGMSFSGTPGTSFTGTINNLIAGSYSSATFSFYRFWATDVWQPIRITHSSISGNNYQGFSFSATASIQHVYPIYYGFTSSVINDTATFNVAVTKLNKYISPYPGLSNSISLSYSGTGYFYIIHHNSFETPISIVRDPNGYVIHNLSDVGYSFFSSDTRLSGLQLSGKSAAGLSTQWKVWRSKNECAFDGNNNFTFKF